MCSVIGWISKHQIRPGSAREEVQHLLNAMHHRGPDAAHMRECSGTTILASNRLRVTDWDNPNADMPMVSGDGRYSIILNGEIYNYSDIRSRLSDYPFVTKSDTEVLLAAYITWGVGCLNMLEGMFAFCVHDAQTDTVFVACDPSGQKSLYLYEDENAVILASEIEPLITNPHRRKDWNLEGLAEYVAHRFILGSATHIRQIIKVESGTWMRIGYGIRETGRFYVVPLGNQQRNAIESVAADIRDAVKRACSRTFRLEVPYGLLLSGGIDSTAILAMAARQGLPMKTFSVGFQLNSMEPSGKSVLDEFVFSRKLAKQYGTEHTELVLSEADYCDYLDRWADMCGEPLGSQEAPCLIRLLEDAPVRVMFCGSGPDEIFDGYGYGKKLSHVAMNDLPEAYFEAFRWMGHTDLKRLMPHYDAHAITVAQYRRILDLYPQISDPVQAVQLLHFHGRLRSYEFRQMDSISMRYSIEARSPLIDSEVVQQAFDFEPSLKHWMSEKGIFKHALRGIVPDYITSRSKQGFPIPSEIWFSPEFEARASLLRENECMLVAVGILDRAYLDELWACRDASVRNLFSRLYTLERIMRRQAANVGFDPF